MRLSFRNINSATVGYGEAGFNGQIGFADLFVSVDGRYYPHAIGAHAPSTLVFDLPQGVQSFSAYAAINDTAESNASADFFVYADAELVAVAHSVRYGDAPRLLEAEIYGARQIRLVVQTGYWPGCHTVWIDPVVSTQDVDFITGVLGDIQIPINASIEYCDTCIAVIVTNGYEDMAEAMLGSLWDNAGCRDATVVIITDHDNTSCQHLASKFNAVVKYIHRVPRDTYIIKSTAYSIARLVRANRYLILDVDMIVTNSLNPLLSSIAVVPNGNILICKEQEANMRSSLQSGIDSYAHPYFGKPGDLSNLKVNVVNAQNCPVFNGGVIAGTREALLGLESAMRDLLPFSAYWEREIVHTNQQVKVKWREQGVMNAALARTGKWSELSGIFNCQLAVSENECSISNGVPTATVDGQTASIIHFNGIIGRDYYSQILHNYRDGVKKPFGIISQSSSPEAIVLGSKLFRSCYRPTASRAFPNIESFWDYQHIWSAIWDEITSKKHSFTLDANTIAMCTSAIAMRASEANAGSMEILTRCQAPDWFVSLAGERLKIGDVELIMSECQDAGKKYDTICMDTSNNTRMIMTMLNISSGLLAPGGSLLLLDIQHPVNDVSVLLEKMRGDGWSDRILIADKDIALYSLKRHE